MNLSGFLCGLLTSASFGLIPLFTLPLMKEGMQFPSILFYRFFVAAIMLGTFLFILRRPMSITRRQLLVILGLSLLYLCSAGFLFWGYNYLPSGVATTLHFLYPVFVTLIMLWGFKEKSSFWQWTSLIMAVVGVACLCLGGAQAQAGVLGVAIVLLSGLGYALYIVAVNKSGVAELGALKLTFYVFLFTSLFLLLFLDGGTRLQPPQTYTSDWNITLLALVPTVISNISLVYAIGKIGSTATSILGAMEPLTAVAIGVWVFSEPFTKAIGWGTALIVGAVFLVVLAPLFKRGPTQAPSVKNTDLLQ